MGKIKLSILTLLLLFSSSFGQTYFAENDVKVSVENSKLYFTIEEYSFQIYDLVCEGDKSILIGVDRNYLLGITENIDPKLISIIIIRDSKLVKGGIFKPGSTKYKAGEAAFQAWNDLAEDKK